MVRKILLGVILLAGMMMVGASSADAGGCHRGGYGYGYGGGYRGGYYGGYHHPHYRGGPVYRNAYYGGPGYWGGPTYGRSGLYIGIGF